MPARKSTPDFAPVFVSLKKILTPYAKAMAVVHDTPSAYYLNSTKPHPTNKQPMMFAAVQVGKNYVSYHYMPIYGSPTLLASLSPGLKKRMQGKACFNFTAIDEACFAELRRLIAEGLKRYKSQEFQQTIADMQ